MSNNTKLELVAEAQEEQLGIITDRRLALRIALDEMDTIGGKDEYEPALPVFLDKYNKQTTTTDILREVFTDARQLKKVIAKLKADHKITVEEKGQTTYVTLVKLAVPKNPAAETPEAVSTTAENPKPAPFPAPAANPATQAPATASV